RYVARRSVRFQAHKWRGSRVDRRYSRCRWSQSLASLLSLRWHVWWVDCQRASRPNKTTIYRKTSSHDSCRYNPHI
ncbi:uncharacterized protein METZ01_LOCUS102162, partial [marine metagenome]